MPLVVPQLRTITLGGAVTGLGIESSSFRNGLPHESVLEMDVLTGDGRGRHRHARRRARDLFAAFPNSYGSLGYATRLRIELEPVPAVRRPAARAVRRPRPRWPRRSPRSPRPRSTTASGSTSSTASSFEPDEAYLTLGRWTDDVADRRRAAASDYTGQQIYYRSLQRARDRRADDLRLPLALGHRLVLVLAGLRRPAPASCAGCGRAAGDAATSTTGSSASTTASSVNDRLDRRAGKPERERVVQDVEIPVDRSRTSSLVRRRGRDAPGVAVPAALRDRDVAALPAGARTRPTSTSASGAPSPSSPDAPTATSTGRSRRGARARRSQVAVLRRVLRPGDVRPLYGGATCAP